MKKQASLSLILILSIISTITGQSPSAQQDGDDVVRITTNLVQLDAVVTDKDGRQVTDLKAEDFEILEDGRPQKITNFSYVETAPASTSQSAKAAAPASTGGAPVPPARIRPSDIRRTIVLVVDDLGMSFESMSQTRSALKKFIDEQVQPGDLVSVVRTSGGTGAMQQFTTDKARLQAAVSRLRWYAAGRAGIDSVNVSGRKDIGGGTNATVAETLKALNFIIGGLKNVPGRKSLLLFSDSFLVFSSTRNSDLARTEKGADKGDKDLLMSGSITRDVVGELIEKRIDGIQDNNVFLGEQRQLSTPTSLLATLIDSANRSAVVIYAIDPRGLPVMAPSGETGSKGMVIKDTEPTQYGATLQDRTQKFYETQIGLGYMAQKTGGFLISNTNDISKGLQKVVNDLEGYYLLGYRPSEETFPKSGKSPSFHSIKVVVRRPGLRVRSRSGFYGVPEEERSTQPVARAEQLLQAANSPFQSGDINLRLTSVFSNDQKMGSFLRSMLYVDAGALTFKTDTDGWQTAGMEVLAMTLSEAGEEMEKMTRAETIQARGATYQRLLRNGLVYSFDVPVKKAGVYQLRVAVRDPVTQKVGSATQLIEVPDLSKGRLALSGIYARGVEAAAAAAQNVNASATPDAVGLLSAPPKIGGGESALDESGAQPSAAARRLRRGMALDYSYVVFNSRRDGSRNPQLKTQVRLFRDGQQVWAGATLPLDAGNQADADRVIANGRLEITPEMLPGQYVLQVIVTDALAGSGANTASQWIDFEIVQ